MRSHSSRVCRDGLFRVVQVVVPGSNWVLVGVLWIWSISCTGVVRVWTSKGVLRCCSRRVCWGGRFRFGQVGGRGRIGVWGGVVGWVVDFLMGSRRPAVFIWWCRQQRGWRLG